MADGAAACAGGGVQWSWLLAVLVVVGSGWLRSRRDVGFAVVVTTQCRAGSVIGDLYATGSALLATGAIPGGDMTFEAALTKLMVLLDNHDPDDVRRLMQDDLAGELAAAAR